MNKPTDLHIQILEKSQITCLDVEALLGDLTDNDLIPTLEGRVHEHIECCKDCQESFSSYRFVIEAAKVLKEEEPESIPTDVQLRLRKALNQRLGLDLPLNINEN